MKLKLDHNYIIKNAGTNTFYEKGDRFVIYRRTGSIFLYDMVVVYVRPRAKPSAIANFLNIIHAPVGKENMQFRNMRELKTHLHDCDVDYDIDYIKNEISKKEKEIRQLKRKYNIPL